MSDLAFDLLLEQINTREPGGEALWVVDENINDAVVSRVKKTEALQVVCNRYDVAQQLRQRGFQVSLSDFDIAGLNKTFKAIFYRVSKEKPIVHHIINQCAQHLQESGQLFLSGYKNEGAKTYIDKAGKYLGEVTRRELGGKTSMIACVQRREVNPAKRLDDSAYNEFITLPVDEALSLLSKPGIYGWKKIDQGSAYLIEQLPEQLAKLGPVNTVVDLGCGNGFLSIMASRYLTDASFHATDNNIASVRCCEQNFQANDINGEVSLDDCGQELTLAADLVLCNPPFHQGFDVESSLTDKFLQSAHRLLKKGGYAYFVVNAFIPLERKSKVLFETVEQVANNKSFKLLLLKK